MFYVPKAMHSHTMSKDLGSFMLPVFWTLEEMRKYYPEPAEYFTLDEVATVKE